MKRIILTGLVALLISGSFASHAFAWGSSSVDKDSSPQQKASYAIGLQIGRNFQSQELSIDTDAFNQGMDDGIAQKDSKLTEDEIKAAMIFLQEQQFKLAMEKAARLQEKTEAYVTNYKSKPGVKTTKSGILYRVLNKGSGKKPSSTSVVRVHYKGTLVDGTEFDSSHKRGQPAEFPLNRVIPGWTEALQMMKEGGKWEVLLPPGLAYGAQGSPPTIPANSYLLFEIEFLKIL